MSRRRRSPAAYIALAVAGVVAVGAVAIALPRLWQVERAGAAGEAASTTDAAAPGRSGAAASGAGAVGTNPAGALGAEAIVALGGAAPLPQAADYCYVSMMIDHHRQALTMSTALLAKDGVWPRAAALAEFILVDQEREMDVMRLWQNAWIAQLSKDASAQAVSAAAHSGHAAVAEGGMDAAEIADLVRCAGRHAEGHAVMAGMMTPDELAALDAAGATEGHLVFLDLMIRHHAGAVDMALAEIATGTNEFAISSAKHVVDEQQREIDAMRTMLTEAP